MPHHFHISHSINKTNEVQILQKLNLLVNIEYLQDQLLGKSKITKNLISNLQLRVEKFAVHGKMINNPIEAYRHVCSVTLKTDL